MSGRGAGAPDDRPRPRALIEAGYGLGDVVEATPTCHAMWLLGYDVDFLVQRPDAADLARLVRGHPAVARVLDDERDADPAAYDVGIACHGPARVVRRLPPGAWCDVSRGDIAREGLLEANLGPARALGFAGPPPPHAIVGPAAATDLAPGTVVVHAGSDPRAPFKRWPHWEALCDRLAARGHPVLVVGTPADESPARWERRHAHRFDLSLVELAALLRAARAYLGNDSGVGHLAGAVGAAGVLLFGPTSARLHAPPSPALRVLEAPRRPDEGYHPFDARFASLDRLPFDEVVAAVDAALAAPTAAGPRPASPRDGPPRGDREARPPSAAEIDGAPRTTEAAERLFRATFGAGVAGALARRDEPAGLAAWRRGLATTLGRIHLLAAAARRGQRTRVARRRARSHLRHAWDAGFRARALLQRVALELTPTRRDQGEGAAPR